MESTPGQKSPDELHIRSTSHTLTLQKTAPRRLPPYHKFFNNEGRTPIEDIL